MDRPWSAMHLLWFIIRRRRFITAITNRAPITIRMRLAIMMATSTGIIVAVSTDGAIIAINGM
jgi:hypothetical protein